MSDKVEVIAPLAIQTLDKNMGSDTVRAHLLAVEHAPHLGEIALVLDNSRGHYYHIDSTGLGGTYVSLNPDPNFYRDRFDSELLEAHYKKFKDFFRERDVITSDKELISTALLHELGHGDDFYSYIEKSKGDTSEAFRISREVRRSQIATLPLKTATSRAERLWANNTNGYRTKMRMKGYSNNRWQRLLMRNAQAYAELPCEQVADRFALGVLATMYS